MARVRYLLLRLAFGVPRRVRNRMRAGLFRYRWLERVGMVGATLDYRAGRGLLVGPGISIEVIPDPDGPRGGAVRLEIGDQVRIGGHCRFEVWAQRDCRIVLGDRCELGEGTSIALRGGSIEVGTGATIRGGSALHVTGGELRLGERAHLREGCMVHCMDSIRVEDRVTAAQYVTIADLDHYHDGTDTYHLDREVSTAPVVIASNTYLGSGCAVLKGVTVGANSMIGAHSVVSRDLPAGHLSLGSPAEPVRRLATDPEVEAAARFPT